MPPRTGTEFVQEASRYIGTPYVWGGESPRGFDCSGLVDYVLSGMGVQNVPRTSEQQYAWVKKVQPDQLQPGDLVFLNFPGEQSPGHVMIYAGGRTVIQAPAPGQKVQRVAFDPQKAGTTEWGGTVVGYGRVPGLDYSGELPGLGGPAVPRLPHSGPAIEGAKRSRPGTGGGGGILGFFEHTGGDIGTAAGWVEAAGGTVAGDIVGGPEAVWSALVGSVSDVTDFLKAALWLVNPLNWLRALETLTGLVLIVVSILVALKAEDAAVGLGIGRVAKEAGAATAALE